MSTNCERGEIGEYFKFPYSHTEAQGKVTPNSFHLCSLFNEPIILSDFEKF